MGSMIYKNKKPLLIFLIPAFAFMVVFLYYPFFLNIWNSFHVIKGLGQSAKGWNDPWYSNYLKIFTDPKMRTAMVNTLWMMLATLIGQVGIALLLAMMVDNIKRGAKLFRVLYFLPIVISATALALLFNLIFLYDTGMLNQIRMAFGANELLDFKKGSLAVLTMIIPVTWQYVGFYFIILVTGLNNISPDIYEAASIDGTTKLQRVRFITLPLLHNVICTCITLAITGALKVFDLPYTMFPNGMPNNKTWLTGTYMYYQTISTKDVDYGSAIALVIVVLGVVLSQIANHALKEKDY